MIFCVFSMLQSKLIYARNKNLCATRYLSLFSHQEIIKVRTIDGVIR